MMRVSPAMVTTALDVRCKLFFFLFSKYKICNHKMLLKCSERKLESVMYMWRLTRVSNKMMQSLHLDAR